MNYYFLHKHFAYRLNRDLNINEQDVLKYPESYLGPNYKEVLNFWVYWESLSPEQWEVYWDRYHRLDHHSHTEKRKFAKKLAAEVIDPRFVSYIGPEELEIIAAHLYLERGIPFTFLSLIFDL